MKMLRQVIGNRKCGLWWRHAVRAAVLSREILKLQGKVK
jgi:hypothetical protein